MSDAKLWINEVGCTATIAGTNVSYTMPLWAFNVMRDIIGAEAEKKVEVTHSDFDTQQELLDRHKAENAKLREVVEAILQCAGETKRDKGCDACPMYNENGEALVRDSWCHLFSALHELGIKVDRQGQQVGSGDRPITAEFDGLIKDAPRFHAMSNSELIAYGYGMFAAGKKIEAENAKLREFAKEACEMARSFYNLGGTFNDLDDLLCEASELGIEVE